MDTEKATSSLLLDTRRKKSSNKFPVKLTINHNGRKERYKTKYEYSREEWSKINREKLRDDKLKSEKRKLNRFVEQVQEIIDNLPEFTFELFRKIYLKPKDKPKQQTVVKLFDLFDEYITLLKNEDR